MEICRSLKPSSNGELFWKSLVPFFRRIYALPVGFKIKPLRKAFSSVTTKTNPNLSGKLAESSNHSFLLPIWWFTFFRHPYSLTSDARMYRGLKEVRSSKAAILVLTWVKHSFSLWVSLRKYVFYEYVLNLIMKISWL